MKRLLKFLLSVSKDITRIIISLLLILLLSGVIGLFSVGVVFLMAIIVFLMAIIVAYIMKLCNYNIYLFIPVLIIIFCLIGHIIIKENPIKNIKNAFNSIKNYLKNKWKESDK